MERCDWVKLDDKVYCAYHDTEWGVPVYNDRVLFEFLILEGAQAGLSWETILKKRAAYKKAFKNFNPKAVAQMTKKDVMRLRADSSIVRNRLKIESVIKNARCFLDVQKEFGSFSEYLWNFVEYTPVVGRWNNVSKIPSETPLSKSISIDLKKRGFSFVGPTIVYAYLQAVGIVNDHTRRCFKSKNL